MIAHGPLFHAELGKRTVAEVGDQYKGLLASVFGGDWRRGHQLVRAWHDRIVARAAEAGFVRDTDSTRREIADTIPAD